MKKVLMFGIVKKVMRIDDLNNNVEINGDNENWRSSSEFIVRKRRFKLEVLPKFCSSFADCQNWTSLELLQPKSV